MSEYIGIIFEAETKEIRAVFNPAYDWQLFDPNLIKCEDEKRKMLIFPREELPALMKPSHIPWILEQAQEILKEI